MPLPEPAEVGDSFNQKELQSVCHDFAYLAPSGLGDLIPRGICLDRQLSQGGESRPVEIVRIGGVAVEDDEVQIDKTDRRYSASFTTTKRVTPRLETRRRTSFSVFNFSLSSTAWSEFFTGVRSIS